MNYLKRISIASIILLFIACNNTPKQSSIAGTIKNLPTEVTEVLLRTPSQIKKIKIDQGTFKDTINVDGKFCFIQIGKFQHILYLDKETQLNIELDASNYESSLKYSGQGKRANQYLNERENYTGQVFVKIDSINNLKPADFNQFRLDFVSNVEHLLKKYDDIPEYVINAEKENLEFFIKNLEQQYNTINALGGTLKKGDASPLFNNYINYKGGTISLNDFKGSYVYIDIWATWCGPCKKEIPFLKILEKEFHQKNIKFVSISIDNPTDKDKWKAMIEDKEMGGVQLFANGDEDFVRQYEVTGIPRFILLDTEGKIILANAPRPSSSKTRKVLTNLP